MESRKMLSTEQILMPRRRCLMVGLLIFLVTSLTSIMLNSFVWGYGFNPVRSISRYVSFEMWSVVVFALGNYIAAFVAAAFLWRLGRLWKMPRIYYYCVFLMALGMICLSMFPSQMFDPGDGTKSIITMMHEISSRTMFIMMLALTIMLALSLYATRSARVVTIVYMMYGLLCVAGYLTGGGWFMNYLLFYEMVYIVGFDVMMFCQKDKRVSLKRSSVKEIMDN